MDRPTPTVPDATSDPDRSSDRYPDRSERDDAVAPAARFRDPDPAAAPRYENAAGDADPRDADELDPADRSAFRIGANLLTLLVLVLGGWWLWRHVLAPALLGSP